MDADNEPKYLIVGVYPSGNKYVLSCQGEGQSYEECVESLSTENRANDAQLFMENKGNAFIIELASDWGLE